MTYELARSQATRVHWSPAEALKRFNEGSIPDGPPVLIRAEFGDLSDDEAAR